VIRELQVDIDADALTVGGVPCLTQASVVSAIRSVADKLEAADARALSVTQFRMLAQGFEELESGPPAVPGRRRGIFGWRRRRDVSTTVYVLEVGCYEQRYIAGVYANPEAATSAHAPERPAYRIRDTYEWSGPDDDGMYHFDADWDDAASVIPYEVHE